MTNNITNVVGLIVLGPKSNYATLVVENAGLYSLPEMSVDTLNKNNIVDCAFELGKQLNLNIEDIGLAYVVEQKVPESNEIIITYYFIVTADEKESLPDNYKWILNQSVEIDKGIYPKNFANEIEEHLKNGGWVMGRIQVIES